MSEADRPETITADNERSLQKLAWAIAASQGEFKLIFARCNYASLRSRLVPRLQELSAVEIRVLVLPESSHTLYAVIRDELGQDQPAALSILGLESVRQLDRMLTSANQVREEFRNHFHFPLVLWITDLVHQKLIELAPDLESWGTTRSFAIAPQELVELFKQTAAQFFANQLKLTPKDCWELEGELTAAQQEFLSAGFLEDLELAANLESLLGFAKYLNGNIDATLVHYQRSLALWQQLPNLERQGHILKDICFCFYLKAIHQADTEHPDWQATRHYLQESLRVLQEAQRPDLIGESIGSLGRVLRHLQEWEQLQALAEQAVPLHTAENNLIKLAKDYGFLAEVALAQRRWHNANYLAQQALANLGQVSDPDIPVLASSWYRFLLARSQYHLGQPQAAILNLEAAKEFSDPVIDLKGYLDILSHLQQLYFEQKEYFKAYAIKQKQRSVEQQFGLRAFIGAGRLESQQQEKSALTQVEYQGSIAHEIVAAGRQRDVEQLVERIGRNDCKLIVIHGQSGVGKSSLVNAGLVPELQHRTIGTQDVLVVPMQVYTNWVGELGRLLAADLVTDVRDTIQGLVERLRGNERLNLRTVLIFDQFEEFFFVYPNPIQRREFFEFLGACLQVLSVKVVLSLREDYLHLLLECNRLPSMAVIGYDILSKNVLYPLGNFSRDDARSLIAQLTERANFYLEPGLIVRLVDDLASELDAVRPIELQVVGAQLQAENITTLDKYNSLGTDPKEELVQRYLAEVVADCGAENQQVAELVLYLLTDEKGTRPLKTRIDLERDLKGLVIDWPTGQRQLDLVLKIFVASGLVFLLPEIPADRYQLVHDYLVDFIRHQQEPKLKAELERERKQRQQAERFIPQEFLQVFGHGNIVDLQLGNAVEAEMTILVTDVRSFSIRTAAMSTQATFNWLNNYFNLVSSVVYNHHGFIDKYIGDAVIALFPSKADDAVLSAIEIQNKLAEYNLEQESQGKEPLSIGMGINTDKLMFIVTVVGLSQRMETTILGEAINQASRLEGLTRVYGVDILISEQTLHRLDNPQKYSPRFINNIQVKSTGKALAVYEIDSTVSRAC
ncbi:MAG TPA: hypothetical protein DC064_24445 [Cyanobacteria bacterium UBA9273]|nr:hypothetical protein [Cyanobacteria bacterium UBA9273]